MSLRIVDQTGQPRSNQEIHDALEAVTEIMLKKPLVLPLFTVHAGIIKDALTELLQRRQVGIKEWKIE